MSEPALLYEKKDGIAFVTMNRPEVRNAINTEMLVRLADAWQDVNDDPAVHVAILRGAGDKAFCAGADLDRLVRMMQGLRPPETDFDQRVLNDYSIIYKVTEDIQQLMVGLLEPTYKETFLGNAQIREVFRITKVGNVAGCMVTEGQVKRGAKVRLLRDKTVIHEGTLSILKRFKDDVKEVPAGQECGMAFAN